METAEDRTEKHDDVRAITLTSGSHEDQKKTMPTVPSQGEYEGVYFPLKT